jgi:hypothetical protein
MLRTSAQVKPHASSWKEQPMALEARGPHPSTSKKQARAGDPGSANQQVAALKKTSRGTSDRSVHRMLLLVAAFCFEATPPPLQTLIPAEFRLCAALVGGSISHHPPPTGNPKYSVSMHDYGRAAKSYQNGLIRELRRHPSLRSSFLSLRSKPLCRFIST